MALSSNGLFWSDPRLPCDLALGPVTARLAVPLARFDGRDLRVETWAEGRRRGIDLILYSGPETLLDFTDMDEAAVAFALSLAIGDGSAADDPFAGLAVQTDQGRLAITWARPDQDDMALSAPMAPMAHRDQMRAVRAALGDRNPWKEDARSARAGSHREIDLKPTKCSGSRLELPDRRGRQTACSESAPPGTLTPLRCWHLQPASSFPQCWRCWPGLRCSNPRKTRLKWVRLLKPHA
jgi:hypothetical protein